LAIGALEAGSAEGQKCADGNKSGVRDGQGWVRGYTKVTARNERSSEGQNLIRGESEIERLRDGGPSIENVQNRLVTSFDSQNRTGGGEEDGVGDEVCGSKVRGDTDIFHETSDVGHGRDIGQDTREIEPARIDGLTTKGSDTLSKGNGMCSFIILDDHELFNGDLGVRESGIEKIAFLEFGKSLGIKVSLELFQYIREFCVQEA